LSDITGKVILDRYHVERLLGRGGMADVYLAFDSQRQTYVAIKLIREDLADDADFIRRFGREAAALARLDHPNIVRFYAAEQDGVLNFIVMDYVSGSNLQRRLSQAGGPLPLPETTTLLHQIGPALHYAHTMGFIHRDIKPGNIMLREDGTALLSDFGAAKVLENSTLATLTVGTPAYMSPEQILGRDLQPQSDIYSFGIVLYEMLVGRRPFTGDEQGLTGTGTLSRLREAHLRLDPPAPSQLNPAIPPMLDGIVVKALAKDVDDRWPNVLSLVDAWDTALGNTGRRGKAAAVAAAPLASSIPTLVGPSASPSGTAGATSVSGYGSAQPITPTAPPSQPQPVVAARPPGAGSPPEVVQAGQPKKGSRTPWVIVGAVVGLLVLAVLAWQVIVPSLAASRPASPVTDVAAAATAPAASAPDTTATAQAAAQLALADQALQTATAAAQSTAEAVSVANTVEVVGKATSQALSTAAAATETAKETEQAQTLAQATADAAAAATEQAVNAAATATSEATPTPQATATAQPKATLAAPTPAKTPPPANSPKAAGVVLDFESATTWRRGTQPYAELTRATDPVHTGGYSAELKYDFPAVQNNFVVFEARPPVGIPGQPTALSAWVYGDGSGHFLNVWLRDAGGQVRQYSFGQIKHEGWQQLTAVLDDAAGWPNVHISGPDTGKLSFPVSLSALVLDGVPDGAASKGTIYIDDLSTGGQAAAGAPAAPAAAAAAPAAAAASALSGRIAVPIFAPDRGAYDLYVGDVNGSNFQRVLDRASQPSLRSDGQQVAFRGWASNDRGISVMDTLGGNQRTLTKYLEDGSPSYSPNSQVLVFSSAREQDRKGRIYQVNVGGGDDWQLKRGSDPVFGVSPEWLSNGLIVYKGEYPQQGIVVMNADGSAPRLLADDASAASPAGSPNGQSVAFMSQRDGNWEVYRVNLDGTGLTRLTNNGANDGLPVWSPDGKSIAFVSNRDGGWAVWAMNADGSNQRRLFSLPGSPDGIVAGEPSYNARGWVTERMDWSR
jgi:eukaryotic-like serine/threonine-protein kinase